jgi:hypothetical protein
MTWLSTLWLRRLRYPHGVGRRLSLALLVRGHPAEAMNQFLQVARPIRAPWWRPFA